MSSTSSSEFGLSNNANELSEYDQPAEVIPGTAVTIDYIEKALMYDARIPRSSKFRISHWEETRIGSYPEDESVSIRLDVVWSLRHARLPTSMLLRVFHTHLDSGSSSGEDSPSSVSIVALLHANECRVYKWLQANKAYYCVPTPLVYHTDVAFAGQPGVIILEDPFNRGRQVNWMTGLRVQQVLNVVRVLASLHAYCLQYSDWQASFRQPDDFAENQLEFLYSSRGLSWCKFLETQGNIASDKISYLKSLYTPQYLLSGMESHKELQIPPVLVHGQLGHHSALFEWESAAKQVGDRLVSIIDWQFAKSGSIMEDLARLLISSTKTELRRNETALFLRYYYNDLCSFFPNKKPPFTFTMVTKAFDAIFPYIGLSLLPSLCEWSRYEKLMGKSGNRDNFFAWVENIIDDAILMSAKDK